MEDPITEAPPPSRFFDEDLNIFTSPPPSQPSPFLHLNPQSPNLKPNLLILALSPVSISILNSFPSKTLIGSLVLPEITKYKLFNLYSVQMNDEIYIVCIVECAVLPERCNAVTKCLLDGMKSDKVLVLDCMKSLNYRGRIHVDEELVFKLESFEEKKSCEKIVNWVEYLPSGSLMDGFGASLMTECQMRGIKGTLIATWPENGGFRVFKRVLGDLGFDVGGIGKEGVRAGSRGHSDLYT